jgi:hypothetical protein
MLSLIAASDKAVLLVGSPVTKKRNATWVRHSCCGAQSNLAQRPWITAANLIETGSAIYQR